MTDISGVPVLVAILLSVWSAIALYFYGSSLQTVLAIILPPLAVFLQVGPTKHFWLNILFTILGYIPGSVHAVWVTARFPSRW